MFLFKRVHSLAFLKVSTTLAIFVLIPFFISDYWIYVFSLAFYYVVMAVSWNLLGGYTGQFSLSHHTFAMIGCDAVESKSKFINEKWTFVKQPAQNASFQFKIYDAQFKIESGMNEYVQQFIRLMKVNPSGEDIFLGGNYIRETC